MYFCFFSSELLLRMEKHLRKFPAFFLIFCSLAKLKPMFNISNSSTQKTKAKGTFLKLLGSFQLQDYYRTYLELTCAVIFAARWKDCGSAKFSKLFKRKMKQLANFQQRLQ